MFLRPSAEKLPIADGILKVQDKYWYVYAPTTMAMPPANRMCVGCNNSRIGFYFVELIFVDGRSTVKIGSLENFQLYGIYCDHSYAMSINP